MWQASAQSLGLLAQTQECPPGTWPLRQAGDTGGCHHKAWGMERARHQTQEALSPLSHVRPGPASALFPGCWPLLGDCDPPVSGHKDATHRWAHLCDNHGPGVPTGVPFNSGKCPGW